MNTRHELTNLPDWRYCLVEKNNKKPHSRSWQNTPLTLDQVPYEYNIGVILGPHSNGVMAIDFDGAWAWEYWDKHIRVAIPTTVTWSSLKPCRAQMAFQVPDYCWDVLCTKKVSSKQRDESGKFPGIEFRWKGGQSVLPPSVNPDTKEPYVWLQAPSDTPVATIPDKVLEHWVTLILHHNNVKEDDRVAPVLDTVTDKKLQELINVLDAVKSSYPSLDYDNWIRVSWATASVIGTDAAKTLLKDYWPEEKRAEYNKLMKGYKFNKSPKIGSLLSMIREDLKSKQPTIINKNILFGV